MRSWLLVSLGLFIAFSSTAQNLFGIATSRYGGTNRVYLNPALAADAPHRFFVNVATGGLHANNNYVRYQAPYSLLSLLTGNVPDAYKRANGSLLFDAEYTSEMLDGRPKNGTVWADVRGPAVSLPIVGLVRLVLASRFRAVAQVVGASQDLLAAVRANLNATSLFSIPNRANQFSANANAYTELAATLALPVWSPDDDDRKLLAGVTVKRLIGLTAGYLVNEGLDYQLQADANAQGQGQLNLTRIRAELGYTNYGQTRSIGPGSLFDANAPGRGWGLDLGLTYVVGPTLQIGLAINDIGQIDYSGEAYSIDRQNVLFKGSDFGAVSGPEAILGVVRDRMGLRPENATARFSSGLPTTLSVSGDLQTDENFGLNVQYLQDLRGTTAIALHQPSLLAVTPRYENRRASALLPIVYINHGVAVGLALRYGPLSIGSDNLLGLFGSASSGIRPRGVDIYAGLSFGIGNTDDGEFDR
jgi:hypothetical protein